MLVFPLAIMMLITMFAAIYGGGTYSGVSQDYQNQTGFEVITDEASDKGSVNIAGAGSHEFSMDTSTTVLAILLTAIAIGIVAGIRILGSGISDISQDLIFNSILFLGIWACLSVISGAIVLEEAVATFLWIFLTVMYVIGVGVHIKGYGG